MGDVTSGGDAHRRRTGRAGEDAAAAWYEAAGYSVVERNWRCREGEIDLIVRAPDGATVFCEVKARWGSAFGLPVDAVTPAKRARVRRLAAVYLATNGSSGAVRIDVASVHNGRVEMVHDAF